MRINKARLLPSFCTRAPGCVSVFHLLTPTASYVELHLFYHDELGNGSLPQPCSSAQRWLWGMDGDVVRVLLHDSARAAFGLPLHIHVHPNSNTALSTPSGETHKNQLCCGGDRELKGLTGSFRDELWLHRENFEKLQHFGHEPRMQTL